MFTAKWHCQKKKKKKSHVFYSHTFRVGCFKTGSRKNSHMVSEADLECVNFIYYSESIFMKKQIKTALLWASVIRHLWDELSDCSLTPFWNEKEHEASRRHWRLKVDKSVAMSYCHEPWCRNQLASMRSGKLGAGQCDAIINKLIGIYEIIIGQTWSKKTKAWHSDSWSRLILLAIADNFIVMETTGHSLM